MLAEQQAIGARIKDRRLALGHTQADLARALGKTQGWVSKVEKGTISLDSTSLINRIAAALACHPNELIRRPYVHSVPENQWQASADLIMRELRRYDLTPSFEGRPRPSSELWQETVRLARLRDAAQNRAIITELPDLLAEARALAELAAGHEREEGFALYTLLCKFAHTSAHALGHPELVALSCDRAAWSASLSADGYMPAVALGMRVWDLWGSASWEDSLTLADKALAQIQDDYDAGDALAMRVWGAGQLRAAVSAARAGREQETEDRIGHAREAAARIDALPEQPFDRYALNFSAGNTTIHAVSVQLELNKHTEAIRLERRADPAHLATLPKSRRGHHHMDMASAWLRDHNRDKAFHELRKAETLAPQLVRNHPVARAALGDLIRGERGRVHEPLRAMENRFRASN
ncbi:helix-turn-helix domain-containing protein [Streptomyces sp. NPDC058157]|uniref:helix-turn-helix domain-containing protein n=1 Tax=Streptomyces sp. NPDC058157 TaxID=3346360 RepID=UPI0036EB5C67